MQYREVLYRDYAGLFGEKDKEPEHYKEQPDDRKGDSIEERYGWYCLIHRLAGGDFLKMDKITNMSLSACLNWLSYTKDVQQQEELNNKN